MGLPIVVARNKIDLLSEDELDRIKKGTPELLRFARWIPVCYIS
jgi:predicted GTPase